MDTNPSSWIAALDRSHQRLDALVEPMDGARLGGPSYASEWSIAQVLSHLGSGAEVFGLFLDAGLSGTDVPGRERMEPIWAAWNAKPAEAQSTDALKADAALIERFRGLDGPARERFHLDLFGMDLDLTGLLRMRLGEHAVHTWDVAVVVDATAVVARDAVELLVDALAATAGRAGRATAGAGAGRVSIVTSEPSREFTLDLGDPVTLAAGTTEGDLPEVRLPSEALIRLVYGRLDPAHTPPVATSGVELDVLRRAFPGF